jgi:glycosyltransferase involved in cell wall biosynthesis
MVAGVVPPAGREKVKATGARVTWAGVVSKENIPALDRSAHMFFSADLNAACPNAVIEALACGTPVVAYATGALPEMLQNSAGLCVPYGADPWKLQPPVVEPLAQAAREIIARRAEFSQAARRRAEQAFDIHAVMQQYLDVLLG